MNNLLIKPRTKKIMVADDDPAIVDAMKTLLELSGYEVTTTDDGAALVDTQDELPDLLLLDIWMSGMDGRKICKTLKAQKRTKHIPIIMVSASKDVEKDSRDAGANDFLAKPFEMDDLLRLIEKYTN